MPCSQGVALPAWLQYDLDNAGAIGIITIDDPVLYFFGNARLASSFHIHDESNARNVLKKPNAVLFDRLFVEVVFPDNRIIQGNLRSAKPG